MHQNSLLHDMWKQVSKNARNIAGDGGKGQNSGVDIQMCGLFNTPATISSTPGCIAYVRFTTIETLKMEFTSTADKYIIYTATNSNVGTLQLLYT